MLDEPSSKVFAAKASPAVAVNPRSSIVGFVAFTFVGYFTIGLALAVLPVFIHQTLGYSTMIAGIVISLQYVTTFFFRGYAGNIVDKKGPKPAVLSGMAGFAVSGVLLFVSWMLREIPALSLSVLVLTRLMTGFGEGLIGASPINWAILAVGDEYTAKAISFNGIASYGALAVGAPCGVLLERNLGLGSLGILIILLSMVGWWFAKGKRPLKGKITKDRASFFTVLKIVAPYGFCLAMGGLGFGSISTFITLYYAHMNWPDAVLSLSTFGGLFIIGRLVFGTAIDKYGGLPVAIACLGTEALGLLILTLAPNPYIALAATGVAGFGFSLVFPALGVEAVRRSPAANKGAALGAYGLFIDCSLGITGPLIGAIASGLGLNYIYAFSMGMVVFGFLYTLSLRRRASI